VAEGREEQDALARGVSGEEVGDLVIEESETSGPEALGIGGQVETAAGDSSFELGGAVTAIPEAREDRSECGETVDVHRRLGGKLLEEAQATRCFAKGTLAQGLECSLEATVGVGTRRKALNGVDDDVEVEERRPWCEEVCGEAARGSVERRRELLKTKRAARVEGACRPSSADHAV
jgi:hypothetical protein